MWLRVRNLISKLIKIKPACENRGLSKENMWKFLCKQEGYLSFLFHGSIDCDVEQCMFLVFNLVLCVCLFQKLECSLFFASRVGLLSLLWVEGEHNVWKICVICVYVFRVFLIFLLLYIWWKINMRKKKCREFKARIGKDSIRKSRINFPHSAWFSSFLSCFQCANVFFFFYFHLILSFLP